MIISRHSPTYSLSFMTAINFKQQEPLSLWQKAVVLSEEYVSLPGQKAVVYPSNLVKIHTQNKKKISVQTILKIATWASGFFLVIAVIIKCLYRLHHFKSIRFIPEPMNPLEVPIEVYEELDNVLPDVLAKKKIIPKINWLGQKNTLVFLLEKFPHLVFKVLDKEHSLNGVKLLERYQNSLKVQDAQQRLQLDLLYIPRCKFAILDNVEVLIEERLDVIEDPSIQSACYQIYPNSFSETFHQLTRLIAATGLHDITPLNIPHLRSPDQKPLYHCVKLAILDPELLDEPTEAFYTDARRSDEDKGLLHYLPKRISLEVLLSAKEYGICLDFQRVKEIWRSRFNESNLLVESM